MDRETITSKLKTMKTKARAARKGGKAEMATSFRRGWRRLRRQLRALEPKVAKPAEEEAAKPA